MISKKKINTVIRLAQKAEKRRKKNKDHYNYKVFYGKLDSYLNSLSFAEVKSIQSIMYLGRDQDFNSNLTPKQIYANQLNYFNNLGWNKKEIEIDQMIFKTPLAEYLIDGKKILKL